MLEYPIHTGNGRGELENPAHEASTAAGGRDRNDDANKVSFKAASVKGSEQVVGKGLVAVQLYQFNCSVAIVTAPPIFALSGDLI